ncbi:hypothetical protein AWP98_10930 [Escherichia coli]|nr:hypothetical protein AWP98_10930 [Escherichia coli]
MEFSIYPIQVLKVQLFEAPRLLMPTNKVLLLLRMIVVIHLVLPSQQLTLMYLLKRELEKVLLAQQLRELFYHQV